MKAHIALILLWLAVLVLMTYGRKSTYDSFDDAILYLALYLLYVDAASC